MNKNIKNKLKIKMDNFIKQHQNNTIKKNIIIFDKYKPLLTKLYSFKEIDYNDLLSIKNTNEIIIINNIEGFLMVNKEINTLIKYNYYNNKYYHNSYILIGKNKFTFFKENASLFI